MVICLITDLRSSDGGMPGDVVGVVTVSLFILMPVFVSYSFIHSIKGIFILFNYEIHTVLNAGEQLWILFPWWQLWGQGTVMSTKKSSIHILFVAELFNEITDVCSSQGLLSNRLGVIPRQLERRLNTFDFPCRYRHSTIISGTQDRVLTFRVTKGKVNLRSILRKYIYIQWEGVVGPNGV